MKPNEIARARVKASPCITPMMKVMVGAMNCRKPMADSGTRRAAQANSISGMAVSGPQAITSARASGSRSAGSPAPCCSQAR